MSSLHKLSEDVVKDTTVLVIGEFWLSIDSDLSSELLAGISGDLNLLGDLEVATLGADVEGLFTGEAEGFSVLAGQELERKDTHADKVRSVDALIALSNDSLDALEVRTLGSPVSGRPGTVLLTSKNDHVLAVLHVASSGVPDCHLVA